MVTASHLHNLWEYEKVSLSNRARGHSHQSGSSLQYRNLTETFHAYFNLSATETWWSGCQDEWFELCFCMYSLTPFAYNVYLKLRDHLLPCIQVTLQQKAEFCLKLSMPPYGFPLSPDKTAHDFVFLNHESIYQQKIIWFNFTIYDIQHGTDIVKLGGSHCNVMLLVDLMDDSSPSDFHSFLYKRVLGTYHANMIYTGPGMLA